MASSRNRVMMSQVNFGMLTGLCLSESVFRCIFPSLSLSAMPCCFPLCYLVTPLDLRH